MNQPAPPKNWLLPLLLFGILAVGMYMGMLIENRNGGSISARPHFSKPGKLDEVLGYIQGRYMDTVNRNELEETAIRAMLEQLDPHSIYISAEDLKEVEEQMSGAFEGIGVEFQLIDDTVTIITPLSGSPADQAGILPGDKIIMVDDSLIAGQGLSSADVVSLLKGPGGSKVRVSIARHGMDSLLHFPLERAQIPLHSIDAAYMLDKETGYIKLNRFSSNAYREFMEALDSLSMKEGLKNLVLDLRENPGGYLPEAIKMLNQFFTDKDILLLYTEGAQSPRRDYKTKGHALYPLEKIAVLIDEGSASASEIVAGALQDQDRGVIVGRRSFGKGLVQEQYKLSDGSALRLTVAHYYTPSGRSIQKPYDNLEEYRHDLARRQENGEFFHADSIKWQDSIRYYTAKGREVHGGGGITPDVFVPIDSVYFDSQLARLRTLVTPFVIRLFESDHLKDYQIPETPEAFLEKEVVTDKILDDFMAFAKRKEIELSHTDARRLSPYLRSFIKAQIGRHLFGDSFYYQVLNQEDKDVQAALKAIY